MVDVAQLVEPRIVIPVVAGSSPVVHPTFRKWFVCADLFGPLAQLVEQLTLNQLVVGSIPTRPTIFHELVLFHACTLTRFGVVPTHCAFVRSRCTARQITSMVRCTGNFLKCMLKMPFRS